MNKKLIILITAFLVWTLSTVGFSLSYIHASKNSGYWSVSVTSLIIGAIIIPILYACLYSSKKMVGWIIIIASVLVIGSAMGAFVLISAFAHFSLF